MNQNVDMLTKLAQQVDAIKTVLADLGKNKLTKTDSDIGELRNKIDAIMDSLSSLENQIMPVSVQNEAVMQMVKSKGNELDARVSELLNGSLAKEYGSKVDSMVMEKVEKALGDLKSVVEESKKSTRDEVSKTTSSLSKDLNFLKSKKTEYDGEAIAKSVEGKLSLSAIKDFGKVIKALSDDVSQSVASQVSQPLTLDVYDGAALVKSGVTKLNASGATYSNGVVTIVGGGGGGTVTSASVVSANGFAGSVATATTTPAITVNTTVTGIVKGNGTALSAAVAETDYVTPTGAGTLTNKTVNLTSNTLSGTKAQFDTALSDDNFAYIGANNTFTATNVFSTGLSANNQLITSVLTPAAGTDAANKDYVDAAAMGQKYKAAVLAASTGDLTLSGPQTVDGIALVAGNRVLVKDQITQTQNGIYVVAAGAWTRATDADTGAELEGASVFVDGGTINNDTLWTCATTSITIGVTNILFVKIGPFVGISTLAAIGATPNANGATVSGSTLNLEPASATFGGVVTTGTQTFAGAKTFNTVTTHTATVDGDVGFGRRLTTNATATGAITINWSTSTDHAITLTGNVTSVAFTAPQLTAGYVKRLTLRINQDATGGRTVAGWAGTVKWAGGTAPTITATASKADIITFDYNGTDYVAVASQNF